MRCPRCEADNPEGMVLQGVCDPSHEALSAIQFRESATSEVLRTGCHIANRADTKAAPSSALYSAAELYPRHLAEKILTAKAEFEDKRKQVTVLFSTLKGSMELIADGTPKTHGLFSTPSSNG